VAAAPPANDPDPLTGLVRAVGRNRELDDDDRASYDRVSAVLGDTFHANNAVECRNSVLRMQQSRHERMTQPTLDLKRLYWNCHPFRSDPGRRPARIKRWGWICGRSTSGHCSRPIRAN